MNTYFKKKGEDGQCAVLVTGDEKLEFEVFALTELTYLSARHINEAQADEKSGKEVIAYFDRKDGGKDELVVFLPWEYVDTHSSADVRDTVRNVRRSIVHLSGRLEQTKIQRTYRVKITLDNGGETDARNGQLPRQARQEAVKKQMYQ